MTACGLSISAKSARLRLTTTLGGGDTGADAAADAAAAAVAVAGAGTGVASGHCPLFPGRGAAVDGLSDGG